MSTFFIQNLGNSKNMIVEIVRQGTNDIVLRCVKDGFKFAISKSNFKQFYDDYDEIYKFDGDQI